MTSEEKKIRLAIRKTLSEMENVLESDMIVRAGVNWQLMKPKFLETVNKLVSKIDDDKYDDAEDLIGSANAMLKIWKAKIRKGKEMVNRVSNVETLDETSVKEALSGKYAPGTGYKKEEEKTMLIQTLVKAMDDIILRKHFKKEKLKNWINMIIDNRYD